MEGSIPASPLRTKTHQITLAVTSQQALGPNASRVALYFSPSALSNYAIAFGEPARLEAGFHLMAGLNPGDWLKADDVGNDITGAVNIIGNVAGGLVGILEVYAP